MRIVEDRREPDDPKLECDNCPKEAIWVLIVESDDFEQDTTYLCDECYQLQKFVGERLN